MPDLVGVFNQLGWASTGTTASSQLEFMEGSAIGLQEEFIDPSGLRGTRSHVSERVRQGKRHVEGSLRFAPNPAEIDVLLPWAMGGTKSGSTIPLAESLPSASLITSRNGMFYTYTGCVVESLRFSCAEGQPLMVELAVQGVDETSGGTIAVAIDSASGGPFTLMDVVVTVGGTAYQLKAIDISIENRLQVLYRNSLTPTTIVPTDRAVTVDLPFSLGEAAALYGSAVGGVAVVATFTNSVTSNTLALTMPAVQAPRQQLPFGERGILDLPWRGTARKLGSTLEFSAANSA